VIGIRVEFQELRATSVDLLRRIPSKVQVLQLRVFFQDIGIAPYYHILLTAMLRNDNLRIILVASLRIVG
jgi:hypothetical protein